MCEFLKVLYISDKKPGEVPISFFEKAEEVKDELLRGVIQDSYKCFWSDRDETPEEAKERHPQKKLPDADEFIKQIKKTKRSKATVVVVGYYNVKVLKFAGTLEELRSVDDPKGRRWLQPNAAFVEPPKGPKGGSQRHLRHRSREHNQQLVVGKENVVTSVKELDNFEDASNDSHGHLHSEPLTDSMNFENRRGLKRKASAESVPRNYFESEGPPLSFLYDLKLKDLEINRLKEENITLKEKLVASEARYENLQENFRHVVEMNVKWQDQEFLRKSSSSKHHERERSSHHKTDRHGSSSSRSSGKDAKSQNRDSASSISKGLFQNAERPKEKENISTANLEHNKSLIEVPKISGIKVLQVETLADGTLTGEMVDYNIDGIGTLTNTATSQNDVGDNILPENKVTPGEHDGDDDDDDENDPANKMIEDYYTSKLFPNGEFHIESNVSSHEPAFLLEPVLDVRAISQQQYDKISRVTAGDKGDSLFVKRLCDLLWTREELAKRSACGVKCPNQPDSKARDACEPEKKGYMRALLTIRVLKDLCGTSFARSDVEKRVKHLNKFITSKIKTIRAAVSKSAK